MKFDYDLVGKIGSMALIRRADNDIDYNIFSRLGAELRPGMIWVSSGATEIGRLDYIRRHGKELDGDREEIKADYAAQGQTILMVTHSVKAASHAGRVLFIKDGQVFHQLYRGQCTDEQLYQKIADTLTMLQAGGDRA